mgnify:CR=1 FL=1
MTHYVTLTLPRFSEPDDLLENVLAHLAAQRGVAGEILFIEQDAGRGRASGGLACVEGRLPSVDQPRFVPPARKADIRSGLNPRCLRTASSIIKLTTIIAPSNDMAAPTAP